MLSGPTLDILFSTAQLEKLCNEEKQAVRKLGPDCARKLRARLNNLEFAANVTELVAGDPHPLVGDRLGEFSVGLAGGKRLVFEPGHDPVPRRPDGGIDWGSVTTVRIVWIGDYHD